MKRILPPVTIAKIRPVITLLVLIAGISVLSGCAAFGKITGSGGDLKKKAAITAFGNRTRMASDEISETFHHRLTAKLTRACSDTLLVTPEEKTFPDYLKNLPRLPSGLVGNYAFATTGRKHGFNSIVTGNLLDIKIDEEASGFWWFKDTRPYAELLVGVEVLDTETGARILDERLSRKIKIDKEAFESLQSEETRMLPLLTKPLQQIADDVGASICDAINGQSWKGYIISVLTDKVILSAGKDTGLIPGDVLEVYDSSNTIRGYAGQQFFLPGLKIGEIRITAVYPDRSEAVVISGKDFREGSSVKRK